MEMFRHGMGGLMDPAIYTNGVFDPEANKLRGALAERLYTSAKAGSV